MMPAADTVSADLDAMLTELVRRSAGLAPQPGVLRLAVVDDPATARHILAHPEAFAKNYAFLDAYAQGRFSANGAPWRQRVAATAPAYRGAAAAVSDQEMRRICALHLGGGNGAGPGAAPDEAPLDADALYDRITAASIEIFSRSIGLSTPVPWPEALLVELRGVLKLRQWIDWNGCAPDDLAEVDAELRLLRERVRSLWQDDAALQSLLHDWTVQARRAPDGDDFDAAEELMQHLLAASETTASALLWSLDVLARQPAVQSELAAALRASDIPGDVICREIDGFLDEVLRLFPPIPLLTRRCVAAGSFGHHHWQPGDVTSISIVGLHRHPTHWSRPLVFDHRRGDFAHAAARGAYLPYSRGARACAGQRLARRELRACIATFLRGWQCQPGARPTGFSYGLSSRPSTSLVAVRRA